MLPQTSANICMLYKLLHQSPYHETFALGGTQETKAMQPSLSYWVFTISHSHTSYQSQRNQKCVDMTCICAVFSRYWTINISNSNSNSSSSSSSRNNNNNNNQISIAPYGCNFSNLRNIKQTISNVNNQFFLSHKRSLTTHRGHCKTMYCTVRRLIVCQLWATQPPDQAPVSL